MTTLDALLLYEPVQVHSFFNIHLTSLLYLHLGRQFFLFFSLYSIWWPTNKTRNVF